MSEITQLLQDLRSIDRHQAQSAEARLISLGTPAIEPLCQLLLHPEDSVKSRAAQVLARMRAHSAVNAIKEALESQPTQGNNDLRGILTRSIADLVRANDKALIPFLSTLLQTDPDLFVRAAAADALGKIGNKSARQALQQAKNDEEVWVKEAATRALAALDAKAALELTASVQGQDEILEDTEAIALGKTLANATDGNGRDRALDALLGRGFRALPVFLSLLGNPRKVVRLTAYRGLGRMRDRRALNALRTRVEDSSLDLEERALGTRALAALLDGRDVDKVSLFSRLAHTDDRFVRAAAIAGLVRIGNRTARDIVLRTLDDPDPFVRESVARSLAAKGDSSWGRDTAPKISRAIREESEISIIAPMLRALGAVEPEEPLSTGLAWSSAKEFFSHSSPAIRLAALSVALDHAPKSQQEFRMALSQLLLDDLREVRVMALNACLKAGVKGIPAAAFRGFLIDNDPNVVKNAIQSLGELGTRAAVELLISLLASPDISVSSLAKQMLVSLDPKGPIRVRFDENGNTSWETVLRCQQCANELGSKEEDDKIRLICPNCAAEHVLARDDRPVLIENAPFGVCYCTNCRQKNLLVWEEDLLVCSISGERYIRAQDGRILKVRNLPLGICSCCGREAQALEQAGERILCPRTGREHTLRDGRYQLAGAAATGDIDAVNRALLAGTLSLTQSGLPADEEEEDVL